MHEDAGRIFLDNSWRKLVGLKEKELSPMGPIPTFKELQASEWSRGFEAIMRSRLIMGSLRYGRMGSPQKPRYSYVKDMKRRIRLYEESGNTEYLADVANNAMLEFVDGYHPKKHFASKEPEKHEGFKSYGNQ